MNRIQEYSTLLPGQLLFWSEYSTEVKYECSCSSLVTAAGLVFIDPLPLAEETLAALLNEAAALPVAILLTNANHQRDSLQLAKKLSISIYAPIETKKEIVANFYFEPEEKLFGLQSFDLQGFGVGETAFFDEEKKVLILGDALTNAGSGGLLLLPKKYCEDQRLAMQSLNKLRTIFPTILITAHGLPVTTKASEKLLSFL